MSASSSRDAQSNKNIEQNAKIRLGRATETRCTCHNNHAVTQPGIIE